MADLIVLGLDGLETGDTVLTRLTALARRGVIDLSDACVVRRDAEGAVQIKPSTRMDNRVSTRGAASAAMAALGGSLSAHGIDDTFVHTLGQTIPLNSSALFLMVAPAMADKVIAEIDHSKLRVLHTSLGSEQENTLKAMIAAQTGTP